MILLVTSSSRIGVGRFHGMPPRRRANVSAAEWSLKLKGNCWVPGMGASPGKAEPTVPRGCELTSCSIHALMARSGDVFVLRSFQGCGCDWLPEAARVSRQLWTNSSMVATPLSCGT